MKWFEFWKTLQSSKNKLSYLIKNNDKPGLVGAVGTILAQVNMNIAGSSLSRESQDGVAISVVNVDDAVSDKVIEQLAQTKDVLSVKSLEI